jgi:hypothetical protein
VIDDELLELVGHAFSPEYKKNRVGGLQVLCLDVILAVGACYVARAGALSIPSG